MNYQFEWYSWILFAASILALFAAFIIWRRRSVAGAGWVILLELAVAVWTIGNGFEGAATTIPLKLFWVQIAYFGITTTPLFYFLFAMAYGRHEAYLTRRSLILLSIVPALTMLAVLTGLWHRAIWAGVTINPETNMGIYEHGWFFWVFIAYTYCLLGAGTLSLLASAVRAAHSYRRQFIIMLLAVIFPLAANVVYLFIPVDLRGYDFTPMGFMASGMILAWGVLRSKVLDLVPVARDRLIDTMGDGVIVLDSRDRIGDLNPAMEEILRLKGKVIIGRPVEQALAGYYPLLSDILLNSIDPFTEFHLRRGSESYYYDMQCSLLRDRSGRPAGRIIVMRDITERKLLEQERSTLIDELQEALTEVKALSGLLPVCANCKSIRDDQGYWHDVEAYLMDHSEATLTHGICPDCMRKLYPDYVDSVSKKRGDSE